MKNIKNKGLIVWFLSLIGGFALFNILKNSRVAMNNLTSVTHFLQTQIANVCSLFPFSVAEFVWSSFFIGAFVLLIYHIVKIIRQNENRLKSFFRLIFAYVCTGLSVYLAITVFWGAYYYADTFEDKSGLTASPVTVDELYATTKFFAEKLNETALNVPRDEKGVFVADKKALCKNSGQIYNNIEKEYTFLNGSYTPSKPMLFSRFFSILGFTGYYFPLTGESQINIDTPACLLPSTIAHEIAHVKGIAPEQTANFVAIRACEVSGNPMYEYSGWLLGYVHLSNALYGADNAKWQEVAQALVPQVNADLKDNNEYWNQFESPVADTADKAYSSFLQGYDQKLGSKSYGAVVDLLVAYYS